MIRMIKDAIKNKYKNILVLQDDLFLIKNFKEIFLKNITLFNDFKLLYLGANDKIIKNLYTKEQLLFHKFYYPKGTSDGAFSVIINESIYQTILDQINFTLPFDSGPLKIMQRKFPSKS